MFYYFISPHCLPVPSHRSIYTPHGYSNIPHERNWQTLGYLSARTGSLHQSGSSLQTRAAPVQNPTPSLNSATASLHTAMAPLHTRMASLSMLHPSRAEIRAGAFAVRE